ncbi:MAG: hypothetical protein K2Y71_03780 [Xanthobacteraceae bacterium]|nr:hypothetical protein [Xanthobacteraceae bacterium]
MSKGLFALMLAGTFMVPHVNPAVGTDSTVGLRVQEPRSQVQYWGALPLAPVPHLETTPWLTPEFLLKGPSIGILSPRLETVGPFLVAPSIPAAQVAVTEAVTE